MTAKPTTLFNKFFSLFQKNKPAFDFVVIVSGLPRSGTSMMMKILQAGGIEILTDSVRSADEDNPEGYFEFERVKQLRSADTKWILDAKGKAVKVISALLEYLPNTINYKILFLERDIQEILASQKQMLIRRAKNGDTVKDDDLAAEFQEHLRKVKYWLARQPNMEVQYVNYSDTLENPSQSIESIGHFLDLALDTERMRTIPNPALYRKRHKNH